MRFCVFNQRLYIVLCHRVHDTLNNNGHFSDLPRKVVGVFPHEDQLLLKTSHLNVSEDLNQALNGNGHHYALSLNLDTPSSPIA